MIEIKKVRYFSLSLIVLFIKYIASLLQEKLVLIIAKGLVDAQSEFLSYMKIKIHFVRNQKFCFSDKIHLGPERILISYFRLSI